MLFPFGLVLFCTSSPAPPGRRRVADEKRKSAARESEGGVVDLDTVATFIPDLELLQVAYEKSLLPMALRISFLAFPTVSSLAFKVFRCDDLDANDELQAVMKADFAVVCWDEDGATTDEYRRIQGIARCALSH